MKIIRIGVEDDRPADHLTYMETPGQHLHIRLSAVAQQWRQIPRVVWMQISPGIKMGAGIGKPFSAAAAPLVDVKSEEVRFRPGKTPHLRFHQNTVRTLVKSYGSMYRRIAAAPKDTGNGIGIRAVLHFIAPYSDYASRGDSDSVLNFPSAGDLADFQALPDLLTKTDSAVIPKRQSESRLYFVPEIPVPEEMLDGHIILPKMDCRY